LFKENIERYSCDEDFYLGVNLNTFYKVIKTITTADAIAFKYKESDPDHLIISIESIEKRSKNTYKMQLLKISEEEELTFDITSFDTVLQMQSYYFQKTCKDLMNTGGVYVELLTSDDCVIFKSDDSLLSCELSLYETHEGFRFKKKPINMSQEGVIEKQTSYGTFTLKHLVTFTKCTTLCPVVTLYLKVNMPLVLQYQVANLGIIRYCVASLEDCEKKEERI
jgi:proliferating cell nuclear antigen